MRSRALDLWLPLRGQLEADCVAADAGATAIGFGGILNEQNVTIGKPVVR